jgi:hypothetical protein
VAEEIFQTGALLLSGVFGPTTWGATGAVLLRV